MRIGFKLELDFAASLLYAELFGQKNILECIGNAGVRQVEVPLGPETRADTIADFAETVAGAGFAISLHPYAERSAFGPAAFEADTRNPCRVFYERIFRFADSLARPGKGPAIVNIHPSADVARVERAILLERSIGFFTWAVSFCALNCPGAVPVAELQISPNRGEEILRIGDRFEELGIISEASGCGLCWDFGHAWLNRMRYGYPDEPPPGLLEKIHHVHCHDVNVEDHQPLVYHRVPWRRYLSLLRDSGFNETVILEVPPASFIDAGGLETFTGSVEAIKMICGE